VLPPVDRKARDRESTAPALLTTFPHAAVEMGDVESLAELLLGRPPRPARCFNGPEWYDIYRCTPDEILPTLASLDASGLVALGEKWRRVLPTHMAEVASGELPVVRALAREAVACGGHLVVYDQV
jgi:hypothetical protein